MSRSKRLYTKFGDKGETSLLYGGRVSKADTHCEAYGATDEACSALGLARASSTDQRVRGIVERVQRELFQVGAELATDPDKYESFKLHFEPISSQITVQLEDFIDDLQAEVSLPRSFIIPGASASSAAIDLARTIVRRAEREAVKLDLSGRLTNNEILKYLNRLGDLLFILARYQDRALPMEKLTEDGT
ncbi:cob(I)yrinic acid a,c-diamide adenosyltransferase [SAR202 cluster bacterium AC-409-J13_OGT_754m]|nr:cob(I)yrinic acid a,c-diamide adenosyltransferase [SAR202 cluster bacterium AC-409-J13_OGT_754m]